MSEKDDSKTNPGGEDLLLSRVTEALTALSGPLTKDVLWGAIAGSHSSEWLQASIALKKTEHPNNQPLGLIDRALEAPEDREARASVQAWFTAVDEELRQDSQLRGVFDTLATRYNVLDASLNISHEIAEETESLRRMFSLSAFSSPFKKPRPRAETPEGPGRILPLA